MLSATRITKSYDGVQALKNASLELRSGEVHALVGENGAGKSTLIKIITGAVQQDSGEVVLDGDVIQHNSPRTARLLGITAIYQQPSLFPELSVVENIAIGSETAGARGIIDWKARYRRAEELLARVGARIDPDSEASSLTMPEQQLVEIAKALGQNAKVLILDEPTSSLSEEDTQNLFRVIRQLREEGVGIVYISHRLEELQLIADRVTVLRDGCTIGTHHMKDVTRQQLIQLMVGRDLSAVFPKREVQLGDVVLDVRNLACAAGGIENVSIFVRAGEIVGLAGLVGAGRTELARTIFGLTPADSGEILLRGENIKIDEPAQAIAAGIAYLPEDRRKHGVIPEMEISANVTLASLDKISKNGSIDFVQEREIAASYVQQLGVKTPSIFAPVSTLSGGNQQKVALSRWLGWPGWESTKPSVLILDEPTQGVDVGAKSEIHALMTNLAEQGAAILMISSELPEVLGMSDRIAVMRNGTITRVLNRNEASQENVLALALGHDE